MIPTAEITEPVSSETAFYIPATGPASRARRTLKQGDTFAVLDAHGDMGVAAGGPDGIFRQDTRYLSYWALAINQRQPLLLGSAVLEKNGGLVIDLTNPDTYENSRLVLAKDTVHIVRFFFLWDGAAHERVLVENHGSTELSLDLSIAYAIDFADIFEVRGMRRPIRGHGLAPLVDRNRVLFTYRGLDGVEARTELEFRPQPARLDRHGVCWELTLPPGGHTSLFATVTGGSPAARARRPFLSSLQRSGRATRALRSRIASIETADPIANEMFDRAGTDLAMLTTETETGPYPYAGIPWYSTTFGRDGILTAMEMLWADPAIARGVLRRLAAFQAKTSDPAADAEPGKILHEMRGGEMARLGEVPFGLYYGSVDSTPLFVWLAGAYYERTGDIESLAPLWPAIVAALDWIDGPGDPDGDGFVEYSRRTESGLANQGWKDSHDAIFHADGRLAEGPVALVEVQAYVYAAKRSIAAVARALGHAALGDALEGDARELALSFDAKFWCDEIGTYAIALDGEKRQCRVATSNAGHALFAGIAPRERAAPIASLLLDREGFSGWGIRTVRAGSARYNPMSYHNGSIWPHDNAVIALGLARYGLRRQALKVTGAIFEAAAEMELRRLPELYCGFRRRPGRGPTLYPVACSPQAWASAATFALAEACLGLRFLPHSDEVRFHRPMLPGNFAWMKIRNLRLGSTKFDVAFDRRGDEVAVSVAGRTGPGGTVVIL